MSSSGGQGKGFENEGMELEKDEKSGVKEAKQNEQNEVEYKSSSTPDDEHYQTDSASKAFEKILSKVGDYGYYQWRLTFITGFCGIFTSFHNMGAVFLAATPDHWCNIPYFQENSLKHDKSFLNVSVPWVRGKKGTLEPSKCTYYSYDYSSLLEQVYYTSVNISSVDLSTLSDILPSNSNVTSCDSWIYDDSIYKSTAVTEWALVCGKRWMMSSIQASYMMGILSGAVIFSAVSDKMGRRVSSLICCVLFFVASVSAAFTKSFGLFLALRFIVAGAGQGMFLVNFILLMETVSLKGRNVMGNLFHIFFSIGFLFLCLFAYLLPEWRHLQLTISIPTLVLLGYYWLLPESPRWLLMCGREEEGLTILKSIAKTNRKTFPTTEELKPLLALIANEVEEEKHVTIRDKITSTLNLVSIVYALNVRHDNSFRTATLTALTVCIQVILVRTPNMRRRNLIIFYAWFVTSMIYYGLSFNSATITPSPYISVAFSALAEFLCYFVIFVLLRVGRRTVVTLGFLGAGLACITVNFIPVDLVGWNLTLATLGKVCISACFLLVFMLSAELVPTHVRNISIGIASMFARIGSGIAPYIVDLLGDIYYAIPMTTFGVLAILAGLLCLLLPETGKKRLPESIEEIEAMHR